MANEQTALPALDLAGKGSMVAYTGLHCCHLQRGADHPMCALRSKP